MILKMMMGKLQGKNPQAYQQINSAMQCGTNPQQFMQQVMGNVNPQQMQNILSQAKNLGVPDDVLQQVQNINNK
jgi:cytochrome c553